MELKVGQKARVKKYKEKPSLWNCGGKMDKFMGRVVTIREVIGVYVCIEECVGCVFIKDDFEPINETIVIYRKDNRVIALDKTTGEKAVAKCNPKDEFDFRIGAKLALERLVGEEKKPEKKLLNTKIIFTNGDGYFKAGRIYEIKDGVMKDPRTNLRVPNISDPFRTLDDAKDYFTKSTYRKCAYGWSENLTLEFIEVIEDQGMVVGSILDIVKSGMDDNIYNFTKDGECSQCGNCCSNLLPMSKSEIKAIHDYIRNHRIKECKHVIPVAETVLYDLTCPFLDSGKEKEKCRIYPVRPLICKKFICDSEKRAKHDRKLMNQTRIIVDVREEFFNQK